MSVYDIGGGGSGRGSVYDTYGGGGTKKKKKKDSFGLDDLGLAGNLVSDVKDAIVGLPAGAKVLVTNPVEAVKGIGESYADTYGPLLRGDIGEFARGVYEHPLGPLLDVLTVATLGAGSAAKAGVLSSKAGQTTLRSPAALRGEFGAPVITKTGSRNPLIRGRESLVDKALKQLDYHFPVVGEGARYGRAAKRAANAEAHVLRQKAAPYIDAYAKLDKDERRALALIGRVPLATHLDAWKQILTRERTPEAQQLLKDISSPKVQRLYEQPSKRMVAAHAEAERLGNKAAEELERLGVLPRGQAEAAKYRHTILASGGQLPGRTRRNAMLRSPSWVKAKRRVDSLQKRYDRLEAKGKRGGFGEGSVYAVDPAGQATVVEGAKGSFRSSSPALERIGGALGVAKEELARIESRYNVKPGPEGPSVAEIRAQIAAAGRPQPLYLPDVPKRVPSRGGGKITYGNPVKQSEGLLFLTGRLALDPDVLGPQYLRTVVYAHWRDLHDTLLDSSVRVRQGEKLPDGYVFVKRPPGVGSDPSLAQLIPNPDEVPEGLAKRGFGSADAADAIVDGKARYAVPAKLAKQFEGEFQRSNTAVKWLIDKPTTVWRALVLNLRVAWLVNNVIGNHLLYALRYAGIGGLRGYLNAIATSKGADAARRLLNMPETRRVLTPEDLAELLPEQAGGTFIGTQAPNIRGGRTLRKAGLGLAGADKAIEGGLRRAAVSIELRRHPAVKARMREMPREARSFRAAARAELSDPNVAADVSARVNRAMGDFMALSPVERRYLRAVFPFYAWYRAITQITLRLPFDTPGRAALLVRLGEVGMEESSKLGPVPSYLEGAIPLGEDRLLKTQGMNPFATVPQLGRAAAVPFVPGQRTNALAGTMNPLVQAAGGLLFGREETKRGLAADFAAGVVTDLPQVGLLTTALRGPEDSKLYEPSGTDELLGFLGAGVKTYNRKRAEELAAQGR